MKSRQVYQVTNKLFWVFIWGLLSGCAHANASTKREQEPAAAQKSAQAAPLVEIQPLRILKDGQIKTVLYADGLLEERGEVLGHLQKDGRFVDLMGHIRVTMSSDGRIVLPEGDIVIGLDGTTSIRIAASRREELRLEKTGIVAGIKEEIRIEGLSDDLRRTAAYVLVLPDILRLLQVEKVH